MQLRIIAHIGSAHTDVELGILLERARHLLHGNQEMRPRRPHTGRASQRPRGLAQRSTSRELVRTGDQVAGPGRTVRTPARLLYDVLASIYDRLGFDVLDDAVFKDLVIARIVEPSSAAQARRARPHRVCDGRRPADVRGRRDPCQRHQTEWDNGVVVISGDALPSCWPSSRSMRSASAKIIPAAGSWARDGDVARFAPRLAAVPGTVYAVVGRQDARDGWSEHARVAVPASHLGPSTVVEVIDPGCEQVPANLLRFSMTEKGIGLKVLRSALAAYDRMLGLDLDHPLSRRVDHEIELRWGGFGMLAC